MNHSTVLNLRSDRLKVVAQLKAAQVTQVLSIFLADLIVLGSRNFITNLFTEYYQTYEPVDSSSATDFQMILQNTENTVAGAAYSYNGTVIVYRINNETIPSNVTLPSILFPLNDTLKIDKIQFLNKGNSIFAGPCIVENGFYLSVTRALVSQRSIGPVNQGTTLGYLTIVSKATSLRNVVQTTDLEDGSSMSLIKLDTGFSSTGPTMIKGQTLYYSYVTPSPICPNCLNSKFSVEPSSPEFFALVNASSGAMINYRFPDYGMVSTGYAPVNLLSQVWGVVVFQRHKYVYQPIITIQNISITSVFSIGAGVCVLTLLLSGWVLRPITRLQAATEQSYSTPRHSSGFWVFLKRISGSVTSGLKKSDINIEKGTPAKPETSPTNNNWLNNYNEDIPAFRLPEKVVTRKYIRDELTELTETFNDMTTELHKQYKHLEERVQERKKEIKKAKILAETANEAKSLFIANITHELRTPLNGILGMAAVAMEEDDPQSVRESLKVIFKSGELLLRLLTDLLSFSKSEVDNDNMKLEIKGFFISEVVSQLHAIFDESSKAAKINFSISMTSDWLSKYELSGDVNRILQIVINLVSNSLKFTPPDGFVKVVISAIKDDEKKNEGNKNLGDPKNENLHIKIPNTRINDRQISEINHSSTVTVSFTVCDSGAGISPHLQSRVFEPFVQGEIGAKETRSGAGLGLSICRDLATLMNGIIDLKSEVGTGSCFTFTVPMEYTVVTEGCNELYGNSVWHTENEMNNAILVEPLHTDGSNKVGNTDNGVEPSHDTHIGTAVKAEKDDTKDKEEEVKDSKILDATESTNKSQNTNNTSTLKAAAEESSNVKPNLNSPTFKGAADTVIQSVGSNNNNVGSVNTGKGKNKLDPKICSNFRVLIAEDNKVNQEVMLKMLRLEGITCVEVAKDGLEAVEAVSKTKASGKAEFDVILMDIQMPNLDGIQATERIRQELEYKGPIIAVSAYADNSNIDRCHLAGMNDFLAKPIKRKQLSNMLSDLIKSKELP